MARFLEMSTVLDNTCNILLEIAGFESLDDHAKYTLRFVSRLPNITRDQILGTNATVGIELGDGKRRHVNGYVTDFSEQGETASSYFDEGGVGKAYLYTIVLHSWSWLLTRTTNCRIFQDLDVVGIVKQLFEKYAFALLDTGKLTGSYRTWNYCCQYRETDYDFFLRMCQTEGITFFFKHENGRHTLVLMDSPGAYQPADGYATIKFAIGQNFVHTDTDAWLAQWRGRHSLKTGKVALTDFNPETPTVDLAARDANPGPYKFSDFERFEYPGNYPVQGEGQAYAKIRLEEEKALEQVFTGAGSARGIGVGNRFTLAEHPDASYNQAYIVICLTFQAHNAAPGSGSGGPGFACQPSAIPAGTAYRPRRTIPQPAVRGPQTAFIVGPPGEEIYTDKFGRVKVQLHWDRLGAGNDKSSCWMPVAQAWTGKKYGAVRLPRIADEVVVSFLEGNPNAPIVTRCLYNALNVPPYDYPGEKTRTGERSKTYKGTGQNEFTFEDKPGKESIFMQAERDHEIRIKNDRMEHVSGESWLSVAKSHHEIVGGEDHHEIVKDRLAKIGAEDHLAIKSDQNNKVGGTYSLKAAEDWFMKAGNNMAAEAGTDIHIKAGANVVLEAGGGLTMKAGGSFVKVDSGGVTMSGPLVKANSGGSAGSGKGAKPNPPKAPEAGKGKDMIGVASERKKKPEKRPGFAQQSTLLKASASSQVACEICEKAAKG